MSLPFNESGIVGGVFLGLMEITGSLFLTLLVIILFLIAIALLLRIPLEFTAIIVLPMLIVFASYEGSAISLLGVALIYLSFLLAKNLLTIT